MEVLDDSKLGYDTFYYLSRIFSRMFTALCRDEDVRCDNECQNFILHAWERCSEVLDGFQTYGDTFYCFSGPLSRSLLLLQS